MLTDKQIRALTPKEKPYKVFDGQGLYLEVNRNGSRYWRLKYRHDGRENRLALGVWPEVSLKLARQRRDEKRRLLANGIDPAAHRDAAKRARAISNAHSFELIAREWFNRKRPAKSSTGVGLLA
jgi:hypothetical protein